MYRLISLLSSNIVPKGHYSVTPKIKFLLFFIINCIISEVVRKAVAIDENYNFANFEEENWTKAYFICYMVPHFPNLPKDQSKL